MHSMKLSSDIESMETTVADEYSKHELLIRESSSSGPIAPILALEAYQIRARLANYKAFESPENTVESSKPIAIPHHLKVLEGMKHKCPKADHRFTSIWTTQVGPPLTVI